MQQLWLKCWKPYTVVYSLALLKMETMVPETCWVIGLSIIVAASSWSYKSFKKYLIWSKKNSSRDRQSEVSVPKLYPSRGSEFLSCRERRHRLCRPPTLLRSRYGGSFPWVKLLQPEAGQSTYPRPEPTLSMRAVLHLHSLPLGFPITVLYPFLISPICVALRVYALRHVSIVLLIQSCVA
jgi:hypothetical protein